MTTSESDNEVIERKIAPDMSENDSLFGSSEGWKYIQLG